MLKVFIWLLCAFLAVKAKALLPSANGSTCASYDSCPNIDPNKLNVHLISHSHNDVGWLRTVDKYFYLEVQYVISSVVLALKENPARRFIQVETYYFWQWWRMQDDQTKADVKQLINEGRLEIINGGWCMNDEANTHYQSTIDQFTLGHRYIEDVLGECARPKVAWQIDTFGHSKEQASIYSQMGFDGFVLGRIDYREVAKRQSERSTDMLWTGSENLGVESNIFSSIIYGGYEYPPNFCFDVNCDERINDDVESPDYDLEQRVKNLVEHITPQAASYPTNNILVTMGADFQYKGAETNFVQIDKLISGFNKFQPTINDQQINIFYSTPSCYVKAVHDSVVDNQMNLTVKTDDFLPYASFPGGYWNGFYISRPTSKRYERVGNNLLQVSKQLTALAGMNRGSSFHLENAVAIMQHHDAITGTELADVEKDYHRLMSLGIEKAVGNISVALSKLNNLDHDLELKYCPLANISICAESKKDYFQVLLYNPLAWTVTEFVQIPVDDGIWAVQDSSGVMLASYLTEPVRDFQFVADNISEITNEKVLVFKASNIPGLGYETYSLTKATKVPTTKTDVDPTSKVIGFDDISVTLDLSTGLINGPVTIKGQQLNLKQQLMFYKNSYGSGAYMFKPQTPDKYSFTDNVTNTIVIGHGMAEIRQDFSDWATQVVRIYKDSDYIELDWTVGPLDVSDDFGKDVFAFFETDLVTNGLFYTDSNSRELIQRRKDYRPSFNYTNEAPISGNYHPITSRVVLRDEQLGTDFAVLTDRPQGVTSLDDGNLEIILHRATLRPEFSADHLYEIEYGQGVIARGSFYLTFGKTKRDGDNKASPAVQRDIAQRTHLRPWLFFTNTTLPKNSFLTADLPENIHLLTLDKWNDTDGTFLLRLEHHLEKNDDEVLSTETTVDLTNIFKNFKVTSAKEMTLNGIVPIGEVSRLNWPQLSSEKPKGVRDDGLKITLAPMQIRTFIISLDGM